MNKLEQLKERKLNLEKEIKRVIKKEQLDREKDIIKFLNFLKVFEMMKNNETIKLYVFGGIIETLNTLEKEEQEKLNKLKELAENTLLEIENSKKKVKKND